jgi:hypothetical protein
MTKKHHVYDTTAMIENDDDLVITKVDCPFPRQQQQRRCHFLATSRRQDSSMDHHHPRKCELYPPGSVTELTSSSSSSSSVEDSELEEEEGSGCGSACAIAWRTERGFCC